MDAVAAAAAAICSLDGGVDGGGVGGGGGWGGGNRGAGGPRRPGANSRSSRVARMERTTGGREGGMAAAAGTHTGWSRGCVLSGDWKRQRGR